MPNQCILAGDLKGVMNPYSDRSTPGQKLGVIPQFFIEWLQAQDLHDLWRVHSGTKKDYTFYSARHSTYSRIDYVFMPSIMLNTIEDAEISTGI